MSDGTRDLNKLPLLWAVAPVAAAALAVGEAFHLVPSAGAAYVAAAVVLLGAAVFAAVFHAEVLAVRIGEPLGSILLALSITALEAGLVISVMASQSSGASTIARDAVFSAVLIVLNGIVGICLVVGGLRHYEQEFRVQGASGILSVIATLGVVALVLPNYTLSSDSASYSQAQLLFVAGSSLVLYCVFVFVQTVRHRGDFVIDSATDAHHGRPGGLAVLRSSLLLALSLAAVVILAESLAPLLETSILALHLPLQLVGVIIAVIVLLPEGLTAVSLARNNRLQTSLNTSLGSALASIGLTIPIVAIASVALGVPLTLGLDQESMALFVLTLFVAALTLSTGRTTVLQGAVHLVIFGVFLLLAAIP